MKKGDHLVSQRFGYTHHGIYLGDQEVIHYTGLADGFSAGAIEVTSMQAFTGGNSCWVKHHSNRAYDADETVERAIGRLGEDWYNVLVNNCEHFVNWCIMGWHSSAQVNQLIAGAVQAQVLLSAASKLNTARNIVSAVALASATSASTATATTVTTATTAAVVSGLATSSALGGTALGGAALGAVGLASAPVLVPLAVGAAAFAAVWSLFD